MRRLLVIACTGLLVLAAAAQSASPPRASAQLDRCHPSLDAAQRYAVFSGAMRSLRAGQDRMEMRFDLFRRARGSLVFKRVPAPGLGVWNRANPGVGRFKFRQKVENLSAPAAYRAVVSFRWAGADGRVFARALHVTLACSQPDLRPNLRIASIKRSAVDSRQYFVTVRNDGGSAARGFDVSLSVGGAPVLPAKTVGLLRGGERTVPPLEFTGPRCTEGSPIVATADTGGVVVESNEADNALTVACPVGGTNSAR
ncbi:MAG TPA: CARDB domain-containing protein [Solirubrobacteraceae bacterium]|nr:CARDB domain-containing protein [Solirubrobacteraceae bacterium]